VVLREDGSPLYHLCSVIDDVDFKITHVVRGEDHVSNTATHVQMFEALTDKVPDFAHLPLISDAEGAKLSKRLGSLSILDIRDNEGLEPMSVCSLLSRLGTSEPIEAFEQIQPLVDSFGFDKFSRGTPKLDPDELLRLNSKIIHEISFDDVRIRLAEMGLHDLDADFWDAVKANLEKVSDIKEWWEVAKGPVTPVIEDDNKDYIANAMASIPPAPWDENTWSAWTSALKESTGRKGRGLFMPLRQALTGMEHGPDMASLLLLIGPDKAAQRLKG